MGGRPGPAPGQDPRSQGGAGGGGTGANRRRWRSGGCRAGAPATPRPVAQVPAGHARRQAQRNFTDPESRILKTKEGFIQGYNAQAAVDGAQQIIVAHALSNGNDQDLVSASAISFT